MVEPETEVKEAMEALVSLSSASSRHLLPCLHKLEDALMKMEPSQFKDSENVFGCALKELLNHHDLHVRVSLALFFCHILRITMLDVPFCSDELLKEVLRFLVSAFDDISDKSCFLYRKRVSILRTFEKDRLFLLMVDLQCDELIVAMFECFFRISETQPDAVFSSMGSIMILTVLKMKRVPLKLTLTLLQTVRNEVEVISPVAHKLAVRVLENCDLKLAPCMSKAVQHLGFPLDDYSVTVAHVISRQFESRALTEVIGSDDDAFEENVVTWGNLLKLTIYKIVTVECNADKRLGRQKSRSSNESCEGSEKIRVKIRNNSPAKLMKEAGIITMNIYNLPDSRSTENRSKILNLGIEDPHGNTSLTRGHNCDGDAGDAPAWSSTIGTSKRKKSRLECSDSQEVIVKASPGSSSGAKSYDRSESKPQSLEGNDINRVEVQANISTKKIIPDCALSDLATKESKEAVGQSVRGDTPTSFHPNKKLLVLDINGLLADIVQDIPERYPCDLIVSNKAVFRRLFCSDFLHFYLTKFNVGVWSSRAKKNMDKIVPFIFRISDRKLLFCWKREKDKLHRLF